jgi:uncharacterized membrane protein YadS
VIASETGPGLAVAAVVAIAAIGMKTSLKALVDMGLKPVMLVVAETVFLAVLVLVVLAWK